MKKIIFLVSLLFVFAPNAPSAMFNATGLAGDTSSGSYFDTTQIVNGAVGTAVALFFREVGPLFTTEEGRMKIALFLSNIRSTFRLLSHEQRLIRNLIPAENMDAGIKQLLEKLLTLHIITNNAAYVEEDCGLKVLVRDPSLTRLQSGYKFHFFGFYPSSSRLVPSEDLVNFNEGNPDQFGDTAMLISKLLQGFDSEESDSTQKKVSDAIHWGKVGVLKVFPRGEIPVPEQLLVLSFGSSNKTGTMLAPLVMVHYSFMLAEDLATDTERERYLSNKAPNNAVLREFFDVQEEHLKPAFQRSLMRHLTTYGTIQRKEELV